MCDLLFVLLFAVTALDGSGRVMDYFRVPWGGGSCGMRCEPSCPCSALGRAQLTSPAVFWVQFLCSVPLTGGVPALCAVLGVRSKPRE